MEPYFGARFPDESHLLKNHTFRNENYQNEASFTNCSMEGVNPTPLPSGRLTQPLVRVIELAGAMS